MASQIDELLRLIYDTNARKKWDVRLTDQFLVESEPVNDGNILILEEEHEKVVRGYQERECIMKRLHWQDSGNFYVYQSSVPDAIHPDEDDARDDALRYDLLHQTTCFKHLGENDILMEQLMQVDFREAHSQTVVQQFEETQNSVLRYWYEDLVVQIKQHQTSTTMSK